MLFLVEMLNHKARLLEILKSAYKLSLLIRQILARQEDSCIQELYFSYHLSRISYFLSRIAYYVSRQKYLDPENYLQGLCQPISQKDNDETD